MSGRHDWAAHVDVGPIFAGRRWSVGSSIIIVCVWIPEERFASVVRELPNGGRMNMSRLSKV